MYLIYCQEVIKMESLSQTQLRNCVLLKPMCVSHQQFLTSQKLLSPVSLHGFVIFVGRVEPIASHVLHLVMKMEENLYKKQYRTWQTAVKVFNKHQIVPTGTQKKGTRYFIYLFLLFGRVELKLGKLGKLGKRENQFLKNHQSKRREEIENKKFLEIFYFSLI